MSEKVAQFQTVRIDGRPTASAYAIAAFVDGTWKITAFGYDEKSLDAQIKELKRKGAVITDKRKPVSGKALRDGWPTEEFFVTQKQRAEAAAEARRSIVRI
jgi:hypothetical protein